jgi:predicted N-formylglutamate amidohydrolase
MAENLGHSNWRFDQCSAKGNCSSNRDQTMTDAPYEIIGSDRPSRWLVTCDHATNRVPDCLGGTLGLPSADMGRHIAYDVGAAGVTRRLADRLNARAILADFSRLVIDPNRGEDDPTLVMKLYDGTIIPANRHVDAAETERRLNTFHRPYHAAYESLATRLENTVICAVHSFTPRLNGRSPRPWPIGVLYSHHDDRLAKPLIARLEAEGFLTGDNEPYLGHLDGDAIDRHALQKGRPNVLIELRNDLIAQEDGQIAWADRLAPILDDVLSQSQL